MTGLMYGSNSSGYGWDGDTQKISQVRVNRSDNALNEEGMRIIITDNVRQITGRGNT
jgi:hypothetical protein